MGTSQRRAELLLGTEGYCEGLLAACVYSSPHPEKLLRGMGMMLPRKALQARRGCLCRVRAGWGRTCCACPPGVGSPTHIPANTLQSCAAGYIVASVRPWDRAAVTSQFTSEQSRAVVLVAWLPV